MFKYYLFLISISLLLLLPTGASHAEEAEKTEKVVVTGYGVNIDKAKENAIRNAVEQVIGIYVTSDTIVKNSQLVKDEILSFSGGYVTETKVISQKKDNDGLNIVQIEATVVSTKLRRKLESLNIAVKKVDGGSLFGESFSKIDAQRNGSEVLGKILAKYPQAAYKIEVGKLEIISTDQNKNTAKITIPLTIRWDDAFIDELKDVSSRVAKEEIKMADLVKFRDDYLYDTAKAKKARLLCFSRKAVIKGKRADVCEMIETDLLKNAFSKARIDEKNMFLSDAGGIPKLSFLIYFKDKDNDVIDSTTWIYGDKWDDSANMSKQNVVEDNSIGTLYSYFNFPLSFWYNQSHALLLTDGVYKKTIETEVDIESLRNAASVEVQIGK